MISLCHHHPPINTPCRGTTNQLSWLPVADLVGSFPTNHPWWEVSAPKNWKPFTGITQFESKRWEKHKVEKPFRLGMWVRGSHSQVSAHWGDSRTSNPSSSRVPSVAFPHSKDFCKSLAHRGQQETFNSQYSPKSHNKQAESLLASDLLFTPKAALRSGTAQGKAASKGSFRSSFPLAH